MLAQLNITHFAIIEQLNLSLHSGLNTLSGETGAGKSIIINAIHLIRGGRSSADLIRTGCEEAVVEALFLLPGQTGLKEILEEFGIPFEDELLIKRIITREGRNRVLINGALATLQMLNRIGPQLISVSGQHEHQVLLRPENHLFLLDGFSGLEEELQAYRQRFAEWRQLQQKIRDLERDLAARKDRLEMSLFQVQEIDGARLTVGEDESLLEERNRLQHAGDLMEIASEGYNLLYEQGESALSSIARCLQGVERGAQLDKALVPIREALQDLTARVEDTAFALRDFEKTVETDPQRLEQVIERLDAIGRLKRKYGKTIEDILRFREETAQRLARLEKADEERGALLKGEQQLREKLTEQAGSLSLKRKQGAIRFEAAVEQTLQSLHMQETRFRVAFETPSDNGVGLGPDGQDQVEFLIAPNVGEELRPLARIASGGELSRILLAVKTILARTGSVETLVFDEVDAGVSGATAQVVGEKLASLAEYHQVLCITHLPQIASQGQAHYRVQKEVAGGRTRTTISLLDPEARVQEIARLLGGRHITEKGLAHARDLLKGRDE